MANTFTLISTITVGSGGASSIDFTSIPSTYTDLYLTTSLRTSDAGLMYNCGLKFNTNVTSTGRRLYGDGSAAASDTTVTPFLTNGTTSTANTFASSYCYIPNYTGSAYKSFSVDSTSENNGTTSYFFVEAGIWSNTAAVNQLTIYSTTSATILQYSSASLYGILKA